MRKAIYPGSFDPITYGHLDIIRRSAAICDELIIGVLNNKAKNPLFSVEERVKMIRDVTKNIDHVTVLSFDGLLIDFAKQTNANIIIRGLRTVTDFEYELQMAQTNHKLEANIETLFMATNLEYAYISSGTVREVAAFGGDVSHFVPEIVNEQIIARKG